MKTDDELRAMWREHGGDFHGPNVETGTMPEAQLLPFLRELMACDDPPAGVQRDYLKERLDSETCDANAVMRILGVLPEYYRTDCGYINLQKIRAAVEHPEEYPWLLGGMGDLLRIAKAACGINPFGSAENANIRDLARAFFQRRDERLEEEQGALLERAKLLMEHADKMRQHIEAHEFDLAAQEAGALELYCSGASDWANRIDQKRRAKHLDKPSAEPIHGWGVV